MSAFKAAVKQLQWIAGGTFTPSALKFAYDNLIRDGKRAEAKVSVVVITDGRFDPRDDDNLLQYLCDNDVVVNAIGVGDMFDKTQDNEILDSIACNKKERVIEMSRYVDLVSEVFTNTMENVLCPGEPRASGTRSGKTTLELLSGSLNVSLLVSPPEPVMVCPNLPCKSRRCCSRRRGFVRWHNRSSVNDPAFFRYRARYICVRPAAGGFGVSAGRLGAPRPGEFPAGP